MLNSNERVSFATLVLAAVALIQGSAERIGTRKVFISAVHRALAIAGHDVGPLDAFKYHLVAAHRAGDLSLARADYVAAMPTETVAASETLTDGASFHFVIDPSAREPWEVAA